MHGSCNSKNQSGFPKIKLISKCKRELHPLCFVADRPGAALIQVVDNGLLGDGVATLAQNAGAFGAALRTQAKFGELSSVKHMPQSDMGGFSTGVWSTLLG